MTPAGRALLDWDARYAAGLVQRYPWDVVVSFLFRYRKPGQDVLEVGCGTGANLWCAAREGFHTTGIDQSEQAIRYARRRFAEEELPGQFHVGAFEKLPFFSEMFDAVLDRGALGYGDTMKAVPEVYRVLRPTGLFLFTPYSHHDTRPDQVQRFTRVQVEKMLQSFEILSLSHVLIDESRTTTAYWKAVAGKD